MSRWRCIALGEEVAEGEEKRKTVREARREVLYIPLVGEVHAGVSMLR
jgi:hypothetical protein